ncbi:MAG TPA: hypothetical protein VM344_01520 [Vitreimonas sp.]|jgi:hypothetical protein|nr:hypothetical protein [Vitreimonas sp.]
MAGPWRPTVGVSSFRGLILTAALALMGLLPACTSGETTITGDIYDDSVSLAQASGPQSVWLELSNRGHLPCDLVAIRTELAPETLPTEDGRITLSTSGSPKDDAYPMDVYIEIDGESGGVDDAVQTGRHAVVEPGQTVRLQLAFTSMPEREERVIACNGAGDYGSGRYAVLPFDR